MLPISTLNFCMSLFVFTTPLTVRRLTAQMAGPLGRGRLQLPAAQLPPTVVIVRVTGQG